MMKWTVIVDEFGDNDVDAQVEIDADGDLDDDDEDEGNDGDGGVDDNLEREDKLSWKRQWRGVNRPLGHLQTSSFLWLRVKIQAD